MLVCWLSYCALATNIWFNTADSRWDFDTDRHVAAFGPALYLPGQKLTIFGETLFRAGFE